MALAGCGSAHPDLSNGKTLFSSKCGGCHTLARANTKGTQSLDTSGPNLDDAFGTSRKDGFGDSVIAGVVKNQIAYPRRGSIMPAGLVTGDDARDVAAYVGSAAGKPGKDSGDLASIGSANTANLSTAAKAGTLTIPADPGGALQFAFGKATSAAGKVTIVMPNDGSTNHNIALKPPGKGAGPIVPPHGKSSFTTTLKPGNYVYYCQVPGHDTAGMHGTLTVK
jgi:plastocyanin